VADELVLAHPGGHVETSSVAVIAGGPSLYLIGNAIFKRLSAPYIPLSHLVGLGLLALLVPAAAVATPLSLSAGSTAILILVAVWEGLSLRRPAD
jgi:low temperature requirement protein LtrA